MADTTNGSSNTAIVAILVIIVLALALLYYFGVFGPRGGDSTTVIDRPSVNIEQPAGSTTRSTTTESTRSTTNQ